MIAPRGLELLGGLGDLLQRGAHPLGELAAGGGNRHALAVAREERRAQVLLERAHLVAHGAVGEVQLLGGAREAFEARGGFEGAQRR